VKRTTLSSALVICLAVLALSASGCQLIAQKATGGALKSATGGAANVSSDSVTITGKDGSQATVAKEAKIPADFPAQVPLRDDGSVNAVITNKTPSGDTAYMVNVRFKIPQNEVIAWYKTEFEKAGWKITATVNSGDGGLIAAEKDNLVVTIVTAGESTEGFVSVATIQVGPKNK
jgi:hypothetical protein